MPSPEDLLYSWTDSRSGFTVLAFALVTAAFVWVAASVATAGLASEAAAVFGAGSTLSPLTVSALAGGSYAVGSTVFGGGGALTSAQQGYLGSTGSGFLEATSFSDVHSRAASQAAATRHVHAPIDAGLTGTSRLYRGDCPDALTAQQCAVASLPAGRLPRPDTVGIQNNVIELRRRYDACLRDGRRGSLLMQCVFQN